MKVAQKEWIKFGILYKNELRNKNTLTYLIKGI